MGWTLFALSHFTELPVNQVCISVRDDSLNMCLQELGYWYSLCSVSSYKAYNILITGLFCVCIIWIGANENGPSTLILTQQSACNRLWLSLLSPLWVRKQDISALSDGKPISMWHIAVLTADWNVWQKLCSLVPCSWAFPCWGVQ